MGRLNRIYLYLLVAGGIVATVLLSVIVRLDQPLRTDAAPRGIVSFELAGSHAEAGRILESWGPEGRRHADLSLRLDYAFLLSYALVLSLLCWIVAAGCPESYSLTRRAGFVLAGCQWLAALLDATENIILHNILAGSAAPYLPTTARWCALVKFALIACGWTYILSAGGFRLICYAKSRRDRSGH